MINKPVQRQIDCIKREIARRENIQTAIALTMTLCETDAERAEIRAELELKRRDIDEMTEVLLTLESLFIAA